MSDVNSLRWRLAHADDIELLVQIDDDAASLFDDAGLDFSGPHLAAFAQAERARWLTAAQRGLVQLVVEPGGKAIAFCALGHVDGCPYLEQLAVARSYMRGGVGRQLLSFAMRWAPGELWLTTYAHVPWNGPMYRRAGFVPVDERDLGPELRAILAEQRAALPDPAQRIAMVRR